MSTFISAHLLKKTFGARPLFDGITFTIESGESIGLIGPNGAGKSTLLKILAGKTSTDEGKISFQKGLKIAYLEQTPSFAVDATVESTVLEGTADPDDWESMAIAHEVMSRLELTEGTVTSRSYLKDLSGGWKKRVALARELAKRPDLLLLDEPTNHLDVESILWLEDFLAEAPFTTLTVTHDRLFLQRTARRILELDRRNSGGLLSVAGDYAAYLETKEQLLLSQERREVILKNTLRRETEWLRRGAKARTTKQQARIQRAENLKEETQDLSSRNQSRAVRLDFQSTERAPKKLIEAQDISKSIAGKTIFKPFSLMITPSSRIGLLGPNGCGKSTLIKVLLGLEPADQGKIERSDSLSVAYFEQNREELDPDLTLSETLCPRGDYVEYKSGRVHIRSYLDRFLFTPEQADMPVGRLSGGEQSRVLIAKLMLRQANVLVLDEPTNDLDMVTLSVLEDCLKEFNGAVLLVTHDRYFLDQVATQILAFDEGKITPFTGVAQWESWHLNEAAKKKAAPRTKAKAQTSSTRSDQKRKLSYKEQEELRTMEETIAKVEAELKELEAESLKSAAHPKKLTELTRAMGELQQKIDGLYARWDELLLNIE